MGEPVSIHIEPAFPARVGDYVYSGMTLRDYFAAAALPGLIDGHHRPVAIAAGAYELADAMLKERGK